nr:RNA polymerase subunit RPO35 [Wadden Sea poxvirus]
MIIMFKDEKIVEIDIHPSLATFIKHGFYNFVKWPVMNIGIVLNNTTTAVNEEWLTVIEHMPTRKIYHEYISKILLKEINFCVYLNISQSQEKEYISMYDFNYYIIDENSNFIIIDKPVEIKETLIHTFQEYRLKNIQNIEIIAFSSGTKITEEIISNINFLNIETFNKEYSNIKPIIQQTFTSILPFIVIAPIGRLTLFIETYPWIDTIKHFKEVLNFLEGTLISTIRSHKIEINDNDTDVNNGSSIYNTNSGILYVNDIITMSIVNFFGCKSRLNTYHKFDMSIIDIEIFLNALSKTFNDIITLF